METETAGATRRRGSREGHPPAGWPPNTPLPNDGGLYWLGSPRNINGSTLPLQFPIGIGATFGVGSGPHSARAKLVPKTIAVKRSGPSSRRVAHDQGDPGRDAGAR